MVAFCSCDGVKAAWHAPDELLNQRVGDDNPRLQVAPTPLAIDEWQVDCRRSLRYRLRRCLYYRYRLRARPRRCSPALSSLPLRPPRSAERSRQT